MLRRIAIALTAVVVLAGCEANIVDYDYQARYPISVETRTAMLILEPAAGGRVKPGDAPAIGEFARDFRNRAAGTITVKVGAASSGDALASTFAADVTTMLTSFGVPAAAIEVSYATDPESAKYGRAEMEFPIYVALADECGTDTDRPEFTTLNEQNNGFGCATQHNFAAMVVDPSDLVDSQAPTGRVAARSNVVVGKYIIGSKVGAAAESPAIAPQTTTGGL